MQEELILQENFKLVELLEHTKKKFHTHVNIIYNYVNQMNQRNKMHATHDPLVAPIIQELHCCLDFVLGHEDQQFIEADWSLTRPATAHNCSHNRS